MTLSREFYARPTLGVSRELIGKVLVHESPAGLTSGVIVEVEAYIGEEDPGVPRRARAHRAQCAALRPAGIRICLPQLRDPQPRECRDGRRASPAAILIRALEPLEGEALMRRRRARGTGRPAAEFDSTELCRGPGNLTRALGITLRHNRMDLTASALRIEDRGLPARDVIWSRRIGINAVRRNGGRCAARDSRIRVRRTGPLVSRPEVRYIRLALHPVARVLVGCDPGMRPSRALARRAIAALGVNRTSGTRH